MSPGPCSKCSRPRDAPNRDHPQGFHYYCRACRAAYAREHRPKYRDLSPEARKRANTRSHTNVMIRRGTLIRQPCEICGAEPAQAHHTDYNDPRTVRWLCPDCHRAEHRSE